MVIDMACLSIVLSALLLVTNPPSDIAANTASQAICQASEKYQLHPAWMVAYLAVENKNFQAYGQGSDIGLFQINQYWNANRLGNNRLSYFNQADAAADIITENISHFGVTWQGVAAYNSWRQAKKESDISHKYFELWRDNLVKIKPLWDRIVDNHG